MVTETGFGLHYLISRQSGGGVVVRTGKIGSPHYDLVNT